MFVYFGLGSYSVIIFIHSSLEYFSRQCLFFLFRVIKPKEIIVKCLLFKLSLFLFSYYLFFLSRFYGRASQSYQMHAVIKTAVVFVIYR